MSNDNQNKFKKYRDEFNKDILNLVNVLNKIFAKDENDNLIYLKEGVGFAELDYIGNNTKINTRNLDYDNLSNKQQSELLKRDLMEKVCKNIAFIYAYPIQKEIKYNQLAGVNQNIPLQDYPNTDPPKQKYGSVGIKNGNLNQYTIAGAVGSQNIYSRPFGNVQQTVCANTEVAKLQEYFYKKLKLLIYLSEIINLDYKNAKDDNAKNQYDKIYLKSLTNDTKKDRIPEAEKKFDEWYQYLQTIFKEVKNDSYTNEELDKYIKCFEETDEKTQTLCVHIYPLCENVEEAVADKEANNVCVKINLHSVTKDICPGDLKTQGLTQAQLEQVSVQGPQVSALGSQVAADVSSQVGSQQRLSPQQLTQPTTAQITTGSGTTDTGTADTGRADTRTGTTQTVTDTGTGASPDKTPDALKITGTPFTQAIEDAEKITPPPKTTPRPPTPPPPPPPKTTPTPPAPPPSLQTTETSTSTSPLKLSETSIPSTRSTTTSPVKLSDEQPKPPPNTPAKTARVIQSIIQSSPLSTKEQETELEDMADRLARISSPLSTPEEKTQASNDLQNQYQKLRIAQDEIQEESQVITKCLGQEKLNEEINKILEKPNISVTDKFNLQQLLKFHEEYIKNLKPRTFQSKYLN